MWFVLVQQRVDCHPGLCERVTSSSDIIVYFVENSLWGDMSLVKSVDQFIHTIPECTVLVVKVLI